jgi:nicotinate dehydrogenase subunit B
MSWLKNFTTLDCSALTPDARATLEKEGFTRRDLLGGLGALVVGFSSVNTLTRTASGQTIQANVSLTATDSWVAVGADGIVTGYTGKCEFGQGFRTVQYQLVAEEMSVPLNHVRLIVCDTNVCPDQGVSSGSQGHIAQFGNAGLRQALATARNALLQMGSQKLGVPVSALVAKNGNIQMINDATTRVTYASLIGGNQFRIAVDPKAPVKDASTYTILGTSVPRWDIPAKVFGQFQYVHNVRVPGMRHGKVMRPASPGAKYISHDPSSIAGMPGNILVVVKNDFVGVVADTDWQAQQAALSLDVQWSTVAPLPDQAKLYDWMLQSRPTRDALTVSNPDVTTKMAAAAKTISATYYHPYQAHGSMGTSCAVADIKCTGATGYGTIWTASQGVYPQRDSVSTLLGIPNLNIRVVFVEGSGCYGLNGADTVCYDAAILSQAAGAPVRVQYSRADEFRGADSFGPPFVIKLKAGVDSSNQIQAWTYESWSVGKGNRPAAGSVGNVISGALAGFPTATIVPAAATAPVTWSNNGNVDSAYGSGTINGAANGTGSITSEQILTHVFDSPFYTGPLRSPNRLQNTFANESFMDEVAAMLKLDPVAFRIQHLVDKRLIACVHAVANAVNWVTRPSPQTGVPKTGVVTGRGLSCCLYEGNNGYCALAAEVSVDQDTGVITVTRFAASQDSGPISNPDGLMNQMEGGALQGMSRALFEEVTWDSTDSNNILSKDWRSYPVFKWGMPVPAIITVPINQPNTPQMGAGECVITCVASAIGNAVFDATGARLRQVPFTPDRVLAALAART